MATKDVRLIETHLSWVFLTGSFVYKLKKPVHFDFVDFSTLALRKYFCEEEVRCNKAFAPDLYVGVVPVVQRADGRLCVEPQEIHADDVVFEYAVKMHEFDDDMQADHLLERDLLGMDEMRDFGARLARQHAGLPELSAVYDPGAAIRDNFKTLAKSSGVVVAGLGEELAALEQLTLAELSSNTPLLLQRHKQGFVRECHGDLHLSNIARLDGGLTAFDCLEFDESLRHIDVWCDAGFLFMDCCIRDRVDLAYAFVDGYLDVTGDYAGAHLLRMFANYRSVVRAKIAALRYDQVAETKAAEKLMQHIRWPLQLYARGLGKVFITCGLSGSGKSHWARQLVSVLPAVRLRSDVMRKVQHGIAPLADSASALGEGLYEHKSSDAVYQELASHAAELARVGEHVIIDAACLKYAQRRVLYESVKAVGAEVELLYFTAPDEVLRQRIASRQVRGDDPSEADVGVLDWQIVEIEAPYGTESFIEIPTVGLELADLVARFSTSNTRPQQNNRE